MNALDISGIVPAEVIKWVGEEPEVKRAYGVAQDLGMAQEYTAESARILQLIDAVVNGSSPVHAVPTLRSAKRQSLQLRNRLVDLFDLLMKNIEKRQRKDESQTFAGLVERHKRLRPLISSLPLDETAFRQREDSAKDVYDSMRKQLSWQDIELDRMDAMIVGLVRYIDKPEYAEDVNSEILKGYIQEMERTRAGVQDKRDEVERLRQDVEKARVQVGFGINEKKANEIVKKTKDLADDYKAYSLNRMGNWGNNAARVEKVISETLQAVTALCTSIDVDAAGRVASMKEQLDKERMHISEYKTELAALNEEAKDVVSGVARENFSGIRKKFYDLILKADLGIIDIAWLRKEEHKERGIRLNQDRTTEIQNLNEEFSDVNNSSSQGPSAGN
jgi:hypothetical protein